MKAINILQDLLELCNKAAAGRTSILSLYSLYKALDGDDFIVFLNGEGLSFDIWSSAKIVKAMLEHEDTKSYICFAKLGSKDYISRIPRITEETQMITFDKI